MKTRSWEETPRQKLMAIPLVLVLVGTIIAMRCWLNTPEQKAEEHRDEMVYRLAALLNEKEDAEHQLIFINIELEKIAAEIAAESNSMEILAESERIRSIIRD